VLLIDQGEELFAQGVSEAERSAFADALKQLVDKQTGVVRGDAAR